MDLNKYRRLVFIFISFLLSGNVLLYAQGGTYLNYDGKLKWLRVNSLHTYFSEHASETETGGDDPRSIRFCWPGEYGLVQTSMRARGMFLGCVDFHDAHINQNFEHYVINSGPKPGEYEDRPIYDAVEFKLVGRFSHPLVVVDDVPDRTSPLYDTIDELDPNLVADRMLLVKNHSAMGVTITKKVYVFTQQYHNNYYIYDFILKNTGIIDNDSTVYQQQLKDFMFMLTYRYALSGESLWENASGEAQGWGIDNTGWGRNVVHEVTGTDGNGIRGHYAWYAPHSARPFTNIDDDWGCPNQNEDGIMAAARYVGHAVIHADTGPDNPTDNRLQPSTTHHFNTDSDELTRATSRYDADRMGKRYTLMTMKHASPTLVEEIAASGQAADLYINSNYSTGGVTALQSFGPYTLDPGDSLHFVFVGGVAGLSREKNREVGGNWLQYYNSTGSPALIMPDKSSAPDHTEYKEAWVLTCRDSLQQTFERAIDNYNSGYTIPQPPPPPDIFTVVSGGDRIRLSWSSNATSDPHFDGYVIYRSEGNVIDPKSVYKKIFECDHSTGIVHEYDDISAVRGFDYYYYIQSKDDGSQNDIQPGVPLYSSMFWTITTDPAYLRRPAVTKDAKATPDVDTTYWELNIPKEEWAATSKYYDREIVSYGGSNYLCICDSTGETNPPVVDTRSWKLVVSKGTWNPAKTYIVADAILYNDVSYVCKYGLSGGTWLDLVRVVPNPYDIRARMFQFGDESQYDRIAFYGLPPVCDLKVYTERGDLIWSKKHTDGSGDELWDSMTSSRQIVVSGIYILYVETPEGESVFRKFVIIR